MYDIVVNPEALEILTDALDEERKFVQEFIDTLYEKVLTVSEEWEGGSYAAFARMIGSYSNYFYNYLDLINAYYDALTTSTPEAIEALESGVKTAMII